MIPAGTRGWCDLRTGGEALSTADRDKIVAKVEELRPEIAKLMLQFGAQEPDFGALMSLLMDDFMFMGYSSGVRMYKHKVTRRYLNIDEKGRTYRWADGQNKYVRVTVADALTHVFEDIEDLQPYRD